MTTIQEMRSIRYKEKYGHKLVAYTVKEFRDRIGMPILHRGAVFVVTGETLEYLCEEDEVRL